MIHACAFGSFTFARLSASREASDQSTAEKALKHDGHKDSSMNGPMTLPRRASMNSLSAPIRSTGGHMILLILDSLHATFVYFIVFMPKIVEGICITLSSRLAGFICSFLRTGYRDSIEDRSKANVVQVKGRFSVMSENVDVVKVFLPSFDTRAKQQ